MKFCIGFDIGGANLKVAATDHTAHQASFPLWKGPEKLASRLAELRAAYPTDARIGVTMTGELADCFDSKQTGVRQIVNSCLEAFGADAQFYQTDGRFVSANFAIENWLKTAASNWHALATWVALKNENGFLIDIGSTTTDMIPFQNGKPFSTGTTDLGRLTNHELVYTGVGRSPISCILNSIDDQNDNKLHLAQEVFATMQDAYLLGGHIPANPNNKNTADGRPLTKLNSQRRIARLLCADPGELQNAEIEHIVTASIESQKRLLTSCLSQLLEKQRNIPHNFYVSGEGDWLAETVIKDVTNNCRITSVQQQIYQDPTDTLEMVPEQSKTTNPAHGSQCAPAYAIAYLLERCIE